MHATSAKGVDTRNAWTPIDKARARLERAASDTQGSMQHFASALQLGEVITKLHTLLVLGVLERFEGGRISSLSFELARASSTGTWVAAMRDGIGRTQASMLP